MELLKRFMKEEDGLGTVEIVLIAVILVGLVTTFKGAITSVMNNITNKLEGDVNNVTGGE